MQPGFVVMVAAHMMFNVQIHADVTGILGTKVTIKFTFPHTVELENNSRIVVHQILKQEKAGGRKKVSENLQDNGRGSFDIHPQNNSVFWHITIVSFNDSGSYYANVVGHAGPVQKSDTVQVNIQEVNTNSAATPRQRNDSDSGDSGQNKRETVAQIVAIVVISTVVLTAATLPCLMWRRFGAKDLQNVLQQAPGGKQEQQSQESSNPTVQQEAASSVVYSVLDFPKRASAVPHNNSNDTDYVNVS